MEQDLSVPYAELDVQEEGELIHNDKTSTLQKFQIFNVEEPPDTHDDCELKPIININSTHTQDNMVNTFSDCCVVNKETQTHKDNSLVNLTSSLDPSQGIILNCNMMDQSQFSASLCKLSESTYAWDGVSKSKSPKLPVCINNISAPALLDSGAELNVLDADFATKAGINFIATSVVARAANKQMLNVTGQSKSDVTLSCFTEEGSKMLLQWKTLNLVKCLCL